MAERTGNLHKVLSEKGEVGVTQVIHNIGVEKSQFQACGILDKLENWSKVTSDIQTLSIVRDGYKIEFEEIPHQSYVTYKFTREILKYRFSKSEQELISNEIEKLCRSNVLELVDDNGPCDDQYLSPIFTLEKKDHSTRMILNLKNLNESVEYKKFKMDTFASVVPLVKKDCYMASIDLKMAYYTIPIHKDYKKYLRFVWNTQIYQYTCLPNGLSSAPRIFTKLMKPVFATLRRLGHTNLGYIDDLYLQSDSYDECLENISDTIRVLEELGFTINREKSVVKPTKTLEFLGFIIDSEHMNIKLSEKKTNIVLNKCLDMHRKNICSLRLLASLIGTLVSVFPAVEYGPLYYRTLEHQKIEGLHTNYGNFESIVNINSEMKFQIRWWIENIKCQCKLINHGNPVLVLYTDAAGSGWGGHLNQEYGAPLLANGVWSDNESVLHSNVLELLAIFYCMKKLCSSVRNVHIRIMSDNTTAISYINNMGGIRSPQCEAVAFMIWQLARGQEIWISAAHVPGVDNCLADRLSRKYDNESEWMLDPLVFKKISVLWGLPEVDMFASSLNRQIDNFVSWKPDSKALYIDAFSVDWTFIFAYIFPPFSQILRVLQKIQTNQSEVVLVVPVWPSQPWFPIVMKLLIDYPRVILASPTVLVLPQSDRRHPLARKLTLMACRLSGHPLKSREFLQGLPKSCYSRGVPELRNNIIQLSENGYYSVIKGRLITFQLI